MYREILKEMLALNNSQAVLQPPALPADIQKAEKAVGYPFPPELKALLSELDGDRWLLLSAREIIETAELMGSLTEYYEDIGRHIFFAQNGCGDYYCYNINSDGAADCGTIYFWEHGINETRPVASGIAELITRYYHAEI